MLPLLSAFALLATGCDGPRILATPTAPVAFSVVGETPDCASCGARALALCRERDASLFPMLFGFDGSGGCHAVCSDGYRQDIPPIQGEPRRACAYDRTVVLRRSDPVCPFGEPTAGDRDFDGHGPRVTGTLYIEPSGDGRSLQAAVEATWTETEPDGSSISLPRTELVSQQLGMRSPFESEGTVVQRVLAPSTTEVDFDRTMEDREESVILAPGSTSPVRQLLIVGDTDFGDISTDDDCGDDARIEAAVFNPIRVRIGRAGG